MSSQTLPEFASSGTVNVPNATKKSNGWSYLEKPAYQYMNWIHKTTYEYCAYIDQFFSATDQFQIDEIIPLTGAVIDVTSASIHLNTTNFLVQKSDSDPATVQFVNSTTGVTTGDGFVVGINASEQAIFQNFENTSMLFYTNNISRMVINNAGVVSISATTASTTKDSGCLVIEGGLGLEGNIFSGGSVNSVLSGLLNKADSDTIYHQYCNSTTGATATDGLLVGIDASENAIFKNQENNGMLFYTNNINRLTIIATGEIGINVTPQTWDATHSVLQIGNVGALVTRSNSILISNNYYYDGANNRYLTTNYSSLLEQTQGAFNFYSADSGNAGDTIPFAARASIRNSATAAAPTLCLSGDTDTGFFSPAANTLAISTEGVERFTVDNNGLIIFTGTGSPVLRILSTGSGGTGAGVIQFGDADDADVGYIEYTHNLNIMKFVANTATMLQLFGNSGLIAVNPAIYDYTVGATYRPLYIDNGGAIGGLHP